MRRVQVRGEAVRQFIVENVEKHPAEISRISGQKFKITRQAVNKHLQRLVAEGALTRSRNTRSRTYHLPPLAHWEKTYPLNPALAEDRVWREDVLPSLGAIPNNVLDIWHYGFTGMINNAIAHSEGTLLSVDLEKTAATTQIAIYDNGVGIFRKIQSALGLLDERHAVLELAKGKLTTDPDRHTGEGIFFTSRMYDDFEILSGGVHFSHTFDDKEDWILEGDRLITGTGVRMKLNNHTARTTRKIFDKFSSGEGYGFTKTIVPVRLVQYGEENLVSRSQAKRLLARVDRFESVILDFQGVEAIGQAFADEIFRVFVKQHPGTQLTDLNASAAVKRMIVRAQGNAEQ